jgi:hypothetical protein
VLFLPVQCMATDFFERAAPANDSTRGLSFGASWETPILFPCKSCNVIGRFLLQGGENDSASGAVIWISGDDPVLCLGNRVGCSVSDLIQSEWFRLDSRL